MGNTILFKMGKIDEAEAAFKAANELKETDITNNNLGAVALKKGEVEAAKEGLLIDKAFERPLLVLHARHSLLVDDQGAVCEINKVRYRQSLID